MDHRPTKLARSLITMLDALEKENGKMLKVQMILILVVIKIHDLIKFKLPISSFFLEILCNFDT